MPPDQPPITIRPMTKDDLPLLEGWIARPHWQEWWGDPAEEIRHIADKVDGKKATRPFIFEVGAVPAGYVQYWLADAERAQDDVLRDHPWLALFPEQTVGIDISIAEAGSLSKGLGSTVVRLMAEQLWRDGYRSIIIDPDQANKRAIRAYEKAGFHVVPEWLGQTDEFLIMRFDPGSLATDPI